MSKESNPPAFACVSGKSNEEGSFLQEGMTLRDYFAAKAMPIVFSAKNMDCNSDAARWAYSMADAMLKEREK